MSRQSLAENSSGALTGTGPAAACFALDGLVPQLRPLGTSSVVEPGEPKGADSA